MDSQRRGGEETYKYSAVVGKQQFLWLAFGGNTRLRDALANGDSEDIPQG